MPRSTDTIFLQGIGAAQDAARMQRVVSFYEKLPRGPAPDMKASGLMGRYKARYFGNNPSAAREYISLGPMARLLQALKLTELFTAIVHVIAALIALGYAQDYYFHLRKTPSVPAYLTHPANGHQDTTKTMLIRTGVLMLSE